MTHQEYRERLEEIYPFCNSTKPDPENPRKCYYCGEFLSGFSHTGKQAITSLIKELVAEAKPGIWVDPEDTDDLEWQGYVSGVDQFEQNLLKELEEV